MADMNIVRVDTCIALKSGFDVFFFYLSGVKGITNLVNIVAGSDDGRVKKNIKAAFERNASIDANNIHVGHSGNKVILTGTVRSYAERHDAEKVAGNAPGVTQVDNQLEVKIPNYLS